MTVFMGIDIGQRRDPTALCVTDYEERLEAGCTRDHYLVRHLDRLPLGMSYPDISRHLERVIARIVARSGEHPWIYVDATGVGAPVVDILEEKVGGAALIPVYFTHGDRRIEDNHEVRLGKAWLVARLQALLQTGRIHLPRTPEAEVLAQELKDYEIRVDENANDRYGAFRVGTHDDLVTALGLAVQRPPYAPRFS